MATSKNATFLFHRDFMEYHKDRFEDCSLMIYKDEQLMALLPAHKIENTLYSHKGLTYGSFMLSSNVKIADVFESFKVLLKFVHDLGLQALEIKIIPRFYNLVASDELEFIMFNSNATLLKRNALMVIDYGAPLKFQKNRREGINRAKRHGLEIRVDSNYEGFWNDILIPNLHNKHQSAPVHTLEEITYLANKFPKNIVQVNVYKDQKIVAGSTVFITKTTIHPQYVSGDEMKNSYGSLDYLYDFLINDFKEGKGYFDFNTSYEDDGISLNKGLIFWKESCGARTIISNDYRVVTNEYKNLQF